MKRIRSELLEPGLLRAARSAAGYDQSQLAAEAGLSAETIGRIERASAKRIYDVADESIRRALERRGVRIRQYDEMIVLEIASKRRGVIAPATF
jgi:transcriptional regulator with XRE-family HTH domain